jgi:hypothetical protein
MADGPSREFERAEICGKGELIYSVPCLRLVAGGSVRFASWVGG